MQEASKFHLEGKSISLDTFQKATIVLTMIGHKLTINDWVYEYYDDKSAPIIRCTVPNCNDLFALIESNMPPSVRLYRYCEATTDEQRAYLEVTRQHYEHYGAPKFAIFAISRAHRDRMSDYILTISKTNQLSPELYRQAVKNYSDFKTMGRDNYCVRMRNLR